MPTAARLPTDLRAGYARFRRDRYPIERDRYVELARDGQRPRALVIACSDSRSAPEVVFDAGPGELFVVRNVGALVPSYAPDATAHGVSAALEFAVLALDVEAVVVLGHGRCGAILAALQPGDPLSATDFVGRWVRDVRALVADPGVVAATSVEDRRLALERRSVEQSLDHLRTFPWVDHRERAGGLSIHGAWFDVGLGELRELGRDGWERVADG